LFADVILGILLISASIQICFYSFVYKRALTRSKRNNSNYFPFSVIVVGRNEESNIKQFLPLVLDQNYYEFEVIFVNDRSSDNSSSVLNELKNNYKHLKIINIVAENNSVGKKYALTQGIYESKYEHLVFIDADTYPTSNNWLEKISNAYYGNTEIVLGYGAYEKHNGFLNKMIRFDTLFIALQYFSFAKIGMPYMGTGRNLSYKKSLFIENRGFVKHKYLLSGDDDLFINEVAQKNNTEIVLEPESITVSVPKFTFNRWFYQKRRHLTTGKYYKSKHLILMGIELFSRLFFWLTCYIVLIYINLLLGIIILLLCLSIKSIIISIFARNVRELGLFFFIPVFDILIPSINLFAVIKNSFIKVKKWN
jgi:cellulose synthase/poly-beta-1,6-N-acetylglucosamine synthase-like glycosyltransferase